MNEYCPRVENLDNEVSVENPDSKIDHISQHSLEELHHDQIFQLV